MADPGYLQRFHRELVDKGLLIEAGWVSCRMASYPNGAAKEHLAEMRCMFFAGAQHLLTCIVNIVEPGDEPTENDLRRMDLIQAELLKFIEEFELRVRAKGGV